MKSLRIGVLLGGDSTERDVSLASGRPVVQALRRLGHQVWVIDTAQDWLDPTEEAALFAQVGVKTAPPSPPQFTHSPASFLRFLTSARRSSVDLWFLAVHGGSGEDGRLQALLESTGIPYTGSGVLGSALAMDKDIAKRLLRSANLATPDWLIGPVSPQQVEAQLGWPVVVKPVKQGSTVGLQIVRKPSDLAPAIEQALLHDNEVMIERFVPGREFTCPVVERVRLSSPATGETDLQNCDLQPLAVGEIVLSQGEIFDYAAKYQPGGAQEIFPARLTLPQRHQVQDMAMAAHRTLKLAGYSRSDFRLDSHDNWWCLEVNTLPGLTTVSLLPQAASASGLSFDALIDRICKLALKAHP